MGLREGLRARGRETRESSASPASEREKKDGESCGRSFGGENERKTEGGRSLNSRLALSARSERASERPTTNAARARMCVRSLRLCAGNIRSARSRHTTNYTTIPFHYLQLSSYLLLATRARARARKSSLLSGAFPAAIPCARCAAFLRFSLLPNTECVPTFEKYISDFVVHRERERKLARFLYNFYRISVQQITSCITHLRMGCRSKAIKVGRTMIHS